jgi:type I restriction enzyme S subunit
MSDLPKGWVKAALGDILHLINGYAFKPSDWGQEGLPIIRIQNLNNPDAKFNLYRYELPEKFLVNPGELLFAWSGTPGTSFGAHIWRGGKAWLNQHIFKVLFDYESLDKQYLRFAINQNLNEYVEAARGGSGLAHITKRQFESSEISIPPIAEQRRIVAEIEKQFTRLDAAVASLRRVQANLKRYRVAVLKAACKGRLVVCLRQTSVKRAKKGRSLSPPNGALRRICAVADEERSGPQFD